MIRWQISHALATRAENVSGDWRDLSECVNLASTRWINAIIGQTWRGENPFKARTAKQGPWLIHLANLRVMYECQGTLVRWGRVECVGSVGWLDGCLVFMGFFFFILLVCCLHVKMLLGCRTVSLRHGCLPLLLPLAISVDKQMDPGHGNDKKMRWVRCVTVLCKWGGEMRLWSAGRQRE